MIARISFKIKIIFFLLIIFLVIGGLFFYDQINYFLTRKETTIQINEEEFWQQRLNYDIVYQKLNIPTAINFLNDKEIIVAEKNGEIKIINLLSKKVIANFNIKNVYNGKDAGLLSLTLHPYFQDNNFVYIYYTTQKKNKIINRVERYILQQKATSTLDNASGSIELYAEAQPVYMLIKDKIILDDIPGSSYSNGGKIKFGPDGYLYIATGDAGNSDNAQNLYSLAGKILRVDDNGKQPLDNPFIDLDDDTSLSLTNRQIKSLIYALGFRHPQGLAWDYRDYLWSLDYSRDNLYDAFDEINLVYAGRNYGWPKKFDKIGDDNKTLNFQEAILSSDRNNDWDPSDLVFYYNNLFFGSFRNEKLYRYHLTDKKLNVYSLQGLGKIYTLELGNDGYLYLGIVTSDSSKSSSLDIDGMIVRINLSQIIFDDLIKDIQIKQPKINDLITSPLLFEGQAKLDWFFDGKLNVEIYDDNGNFLGLTTLQAKNQINDNFIVFKEYIEFSKPATTSGIVKFYSYNPNLSLAKQKFLIIPVKFQDLAYEKILLYVYDKSKDRDKRGNIKCTQAGITSMETKVLVKNNIIKDTLDLLFQKDSQLNLDKINNNLANYVPSLSLKIKSVQLNNEGLLTIFVDDFIKKNISRCFLNIAKMQIEQTLKQFAEVRQVQFEPEIFF
ncbi:MAG: hypothetical protein KatS3mg097_072 [Candidatus Parcubacteria bacterium]|nr:MAG: hypothetical protein KatS3mg097_072 [Candidatus Parcubacteria bacterium]